MIKSLVFFQLFLSVSCVEKPSNPIHVPFSAPTFYHAIWFNLTIGGQTATELVTIGSLYTKPELQIAETMWDYNSTKSYSFHETKKLGPKITDGVCGTETFQLGGVKLGEKPFKLTPVFIEENSFGVAHSEMGLYRSDSTGKGCKSFVESILEECPEKVLTFAYNNDVESGVLKEYTGQLSFGDKLPNLCSENWAYMPEVSRPGNHRDSNVKKQWFFKIDKVSIGKISHSSPIYATVNFGTHAFYLPKRLFDEVQRELNPHDKENYDWLNVNKINYIPCTMKKDIVLQMGGGELRIPASFYSLRNTYSPSNPKCQVLIYQSEDENLYLPQLSFSNHCVLFDYENKRIGHSKRI